VPATHAATTPRSGCRARRWHAPPEDPRR
jgi:hypothetical protein